MARTKNKTPAYPAEFYLRIGTSSHGLDTIVFTVFCVYGGENSLLFVCPRCNTIHSYSAGAYGGSSDGVVPAPRCRERDPSGEPDIASHMETFDAFLGFMGGKTFAWELHEISEYMDLLSAGNLRGREKVIYPRRRGEPGYDQGAWGRSNRTRSVRKLIADYEKAGR